MAQVNFATTLPEYALEILHRRADHDGLDPGAWLAAIYDKATRDGMREPAVRRDTARTRFIADTEAQRLLRFRTESE
ncbi:hypothetical protein [Hamadaea tsunoensis]|uniref:hypothetical protein n=1 Tax=Hamadaea tsunoensis TaxID=53368 RepID=UPI000404EFFE|nr:hypothetical protein [Hamadaea tsunoensis]